MVERQLPKLHTRVRFPSPAPELSMVFGKCAKSVPLDSGESANRCATRSFRSGVGFLSVVGVAGEGPGGRTLCHCSHRRPDLDSAQYLESFAAVCSWRGECSGAPWRCWPARAPPEPLQCQRRSITTKTPRCRATNGSSPGRSALPDRPDRSATCRLTIPRPTARTLRLTRRRLLLTDNSVYQWDCGPPEDFQGVGARCELAQADEFAACFHGSAKRPNATSSARLVAERRKPVLGLPISNRCSLVWHDVSCGHGVGAPRIAVGCS